MEKELNVDLTITMKMQPGETEEDAEERFYNALYSRLCSDNDEFDYTIERVSTENV